MSDVLLRFLNSVSCLRHFRLFVAHSLRYDAAFFTADGKLLCGSSLDHPSVTMTLKELIRTGHTIVIDGTSVVADLTPMVDTVASSGGELDLYKVYNKIGEDGIDFELIPA